MGPLVRILLIEDSPEDAELIERTLVRSNGYQYEIKRVDTMRDVITALDTTSFDMIICDYALQGFDAPAVIQLTDDREIDIPIVLLSGFASEDQVHKAMKMGADEYVDKNHLHKLIPVIRRELRISTAYDETLKAFVRALSFRDNETSGHSERVVDLSKQLARRMGLQETAIVHLSRGALLHDIGKLGVPDTILLKKGPLSEEEYERMKMHTIIGRDLLSQIPFLKKAIEIPHYHHERWNGSGYPYGLTGHHIPIAARLFAIVDVYDALTSQRSYRDAQEKPLVMKYIQSQSQILFDPEVVQHFIEMMEVP